MIIIIGAFVITRVFSKVDIPPGVCTSIPINCGFPFYLFTPSMLVTGLENFVEAGLAFGGSAYLLEKLFDSGVLSKFPKNG